MNNTIPRAIAVSTVEEYDDNAQLENGLLVVMAIFLFGALMVVLLEYMNFIKETHIKKSSCTSFQTKAYFY